MLLKIFEGSNEKFNSSNLVTVKKELIQRKPFLHMLFKRKSFFFFICSNTSNFFLMDEEAFLKFGRKYIAINSKKPFAKISRFENFIPVITTKCNLNCSYCVGYGGIKKGKDSSFELIKASTDFLAKHQNWPMLIDFVTSGEPLLNEHLFLKTINYAKKKLNVKQFKLSTNGTISPSNYLAVLKENYFGDSFQISCDGPPEIQDKVRPFTNEGKSSIIVENHIRALVSKNQDFTIKITLTYAHIGKEQKTVKYFNSLGVEKIFVSIVGCMGKAATNKKNKKRHMNYYRKLIRSQLAIKEMCDLVNLRCLVPAQKSLGNKFACGCAVCNTFLVTPEGFITPCAMLGDKEDILNHGASYLIFGRYDVKSKKIVLDYKKLKELRNWYKKVKLCQKCDFKLCWGGCLLRNLRENKTIYIPDKMHCDDRKEEILEYFRYLANKETIKLRPYLEDGKDGLRLLGHYFIATISQSIHSAIKKDVLLIKFDPQKEDFDRLFFEIVSFNKRSKGLGLVLLSPICKQQLNPRETIVFKEFLYNLKAARVLFLVTKPIFVQEMSKEAEKKFYSEFRIPSDCFGCLELFKVVQDGKIKFCNDRPGPKIGNILDRKTLYEKYFLQNQIKKV
ncbi:MAG: radical SAM protein [Candidatus Diapherotrites archaeon]|nr:radical SAM protein [Candidatus Diapherotrites archaeon]